MVGKGEMSCIGELFFFSWPYIEHYGGSRLLLEVIVEQECNATRSNPWGEMTNRNHFVATERVMPECLLSKEKLPPTPCQSTSRLSLIWFLQKARSSQNIWPNIWVKLPSHSFPRTPHFRPQFRQLIPAKTAILSFHNICQVQNISNISKWETAMLS